MQQRTFAEPLCSTPFPGTCSSSIPKLTCILAKLCARVSFRNRAQRAPAAQQKQAKSHMVFDTPSVSNISPNVNVAISDRSQLKQTTHAAAASLICIGKVSPNSAHEIGPTPALKVTKSRMVQVGGIQK
ncbi:hypothetical protein PUN28_010203 [Cardiocondyla obscurior]|uniref:Uncharacterized protein n=1 Tax=Cardiocondyla obscurior TaxID=286306 RepID=A0AAW2FP35_9HYME